MIDPLPFDVAQIGTHWWAVPLYILAYIVLDLLFIPTQVLSIAAVLMWGWAWGGTIELMAATIGALPQYLIARKTLRDWVSRKLAKHAAIARTLEREPFTLLLLLRVVPIVPYTALNWVAGLSPVRPAQYLIATLIGMIPSTYVFAYFVQALVDGVMQPREVTLRIFAAGGLFAALIIVTRLVAPRVRRRLEASSAHTSSPPASADRD